MSYLVANNDREMLNFLMEAFDNEHWECEDCGNSEDCATMDSAIALRAYLKAKPTDTISVSKGEWEAMKNGLRSARDLLSSVEGISRNNFVQLASEEIVSIDKALNAYKPADDTISVSKAEWEAMLADKKRIDWLNDNFYNANNTMDDMDKRLRPNTWAWIFYAPKDTQADVRKVLDAAIQGASNG
jgi:hypothetical protein